MESMREFLTSSSTQSAVKSALSSATASGDVTSGSLLTKVNRITTQAAKMDASLYQEWFNTAKSKIWTSSELGYDIKYPVVLRSLIPVFYAGTKDIDIEVDQIFRPSGSKVNDSSNNFANREKLHITVKGTNSGKTEKSKLSAVKYTKD